MAPTLFNLALEYIIRKLPIDRNSTLEHKVVQIVGYADDINTVSYTHLDVYKRQV